MLTYQINLFPTKTPAYSHLIWTNVDSFIEAANSRNPARLHLNLNPFEYCIHGLCISTTCSLLEQLITL